MNNLKDLRDYVKSTGYKVTVKTNGDFCPLTNKKVYALFSNGVRISPSFTVQEWTPFLIDSQFKKINLK